MRLRFFSRIFFGERNLSKESEAVRSFDVEIIEESRKSLIILIKKFLTRNQNAPFTPASARKQIQFQEEIKEIAERY